jgi:hypothetical protein
MVHITIRRRAASAGVAGALLAMLAIAPSAHATTYYACAKKKGGALRAVSRTTKCKRSERKIAFNSKGLPGKPGITAPTAPTGLTARTARSALRAPSPMM